MINAASIARQGLGFGPSAIAKQGFLTSTAAFIIVAGVSCSSGMAGAQAGTAALAGGQSVTVSGLAAQAGAAIMVTGRSASANSFAGQFKANVLATAYMQSTSAASAATALFAVISGQSVAGAAAMASRALQALAQSQSVATSAGFALPAAYVVVAGVSAAHSFANIAKSLAASANAQSLSASFCIAAQARVSLGTAVFPGISSVVGGPLSFAASLGTSRAQSAYPVTAFGARWTDYIVALSHADDAFYRAASEQADYAAYLSDPFTRAVSQPVLFAARSDVASYGARSEIYNEN